ncbi:MAG: hypothetical protein Q9195_006222 [Heterodermia aff. obscurata]
MHISTTCPSPSPQTATSTQLGCISLIVIACTTTATVLAILLLALLAWRQSRKDKKSRERDLDLEEHAFSARGFTRAESMVSEEGEGEGGERPPSYRENEVMVVEAPREGTLPSVYEVEKKEGGGQGANVGRATMPETWRDSMDLRP